MNSGDTAWVLVSTAMVLIMTPGLAFFYGGLVRQKNVVNTIKMSFIALGLIAVQWALIGYSMAFAPGNAFIGGLRFVGLAGVSAQPNPDIANNIPHVLFMLFQMMFAIITPALISGAVVGRMKFRAYAAFIVLWALLVYNPLAHWVWGPGGWLGELGALDFAGGTVVHISAGVSALVAALILGPRRGQGRDRSERPHSVPFVVLGAALLWFGWFGFNAGSALAANGVAAIAITTTMLAASAALVTWVFTEMVRGRKPTAVGASIAAVVGLVAVTPAAGFVTPLSAICIGMIAALVSYGAMQVLPRGIDDTLDVFACHGLGGVSGALLTGVFATQSVNPAASNGLLYGGTALFEAQVIGVVASVLFAAAGTAVALGLVRVFAPLRTSEVEERLGIDVSEHNEPAYSMELRRRTFDSLRIRRDAITGG